MRDKLSKILLLSGLRARLSLASERLSDKARCLCSLKLVESLRCSLIEERDFSLRCLHQLVSIFLLLLLSLVFYAIGHYVQEMLNLLLFPNEANAFLEVSDHLI